MPVSLVITCISIIALQLPVTTLSTTPRFEPATFEAESNNSLIEVYDYMMMNNGTSDEFAAPQALIVCVTSIRFVITLAGIVANSMVCIAITKFRNLQNVGNYFVFNLSLSDLLSALFDLTQAFPKLFGLLEVNSVPCNVEMIGNTLTTISVFFLVAISTDRFIFIEYPMKYHNLIQRTFKFQIAAIWLGVTTLWSAMNFEMICGGFSSELSKYALQYQLFTIVLFATCFTLMAVQYARILATARRQYLRSKQMACYQVTTATNQQADGNSSYQMNEVDDSSKRNGAQRSNRGGGNFNTEIPVKMILGFVIIVGMACMTYLVFPIPFYILIIFDFHKDAYWVRHMSVLKQITGLQLSLNTSCNPLIYAVTQKKYRDAFMEMFKKMFTRSSRSGHQLDLDEPDITCCGCIKVKKSSNMFSDNNCTVNETCT